MNLIQVYNKWDVFICKFDFYNSTLKDRGNHITNESFHHIWLNEGFATYSEALWVEATYGQGQIEWQTDGFPRATYFCRLTIGEYQEVVKVVVLE